MTAERPRPEFSTFASTIAVALAGGMAFTLAGMPAPWLSGPAVAVAATTIAGAQLGVPRLVRTAALVFLGATMGTAVTPDTLGMMSRWPLSLAGLAFAVTAIMATIALYLERVHGYDRATARLAGVPGALPFVLALAAESQGDARRVAIIQMMRLLLLLVCLPTILTLAGASRAPSGASLAVAADVALPALLPRLALLLVAGTLGGLVFERLKAPAGMLFGAMIASALLCGSGIIALAMPGWLMLPGYVIIGAMVGSNFAGTDLDLLRRTALAGIGSVLVGGGVALACAIVVANILHLPVAQVFLAYAPGGVETMTIMALALGLDPAYVGAHHVARFLGLGLIVPWWLKGHLRRRD
ncbi:MAG: AbrB family transcriptional regulator [Hyphomicrobiaceae bacterium]